ncbi:unnamed protein product [Amoebophrya sp. A25]|nr:unnamed protein product [Amoebophrya sp. A25]|eukprot:GSA25T00011545001.1
MYRVGANNGLHHAAFRGSEQPTNWDTKRVELAAETNIMNKYLSDEADRYQNLHNKKCSVFSTTYYRAATYSPQRAEHCVKFIMPTRYQSDKKALTAKYVSRGHTRYNYNTTLEDKARAAKAASAAPKRQTLSIRPKGYASVSNLQAQAEKKALDEAEKNTTPTKKVQLRTTTSESRTQTGGRGTPRKIQHTTSNTSTPSPPPLPRQELHLGKCSTRNHDAEVVDPDLIISATGGGARGAVGTNSTTAEEQLPQEKKWWTTMATTSPPKRSHEDSRDLYDSRGIRLVKEWRKGTMPSTLWHPMYVVDTRDPRDVLRWQARVPLSRSESPTGSERVEARAATRRTVHLPGKSGPLIDPRSVLDQGQAEQLQRIKASFERKLLEQQRQMRKENRRKIREEKEITKTLKSLGLGM